VFKYEAFFAHYFEVGTGNRSEEIYVKCIFHPDNNPSLSIDLSSGLWHCFGCDAGGTVADFYSRIHSVPLHRAKRAVSAYLSNEPWARPIRESEIQGWHNILMSNPELLSFLKEKRGIHPQTVVRFLLGFDGRRITIPIRSQHGSYIINVRKYDPNSEGTNKVISHSPGYGDVRFFPQENLNNTGAVYLFEGEMDTLLANQLGYNAITATGGAGSLPYNAADLLSNRRVNICYDKDAAGKRGVEKVAAELTLSDVYVIDLPDEFEGYDFTDHILADRDFDTLVRDAKLYERGKPVESLVSLFEARDARFVGSPVAVEIRTVGKDLAPYDIPASVSFVCEHMSAENKMCRVCSIFHQGSGDVDFTVDRVSELALKLIRVREDALYRTLKQLAGVNTKCPFPSVVINRKDSLEELLVAPHIEKRGYQQSAEGVYALQRCYYRGYGIVTNKSYKMSGVRLTDPSDQTATFIFDRAEPIQDSVDQFVLTEDIREELKVFKPSKNQAVYDKVYEIADSLTNAVTQIYGRHDLLMGVLLTYCSVNSFVFQKTEVSKGFIELLIIGDTRTGKSEALDRIVDHINLGEIIYGENTSYPGLVGGLQQASGRWFLTWGKLPQNDRGIVIIDEASGLRLSDIAKLSGVRSSGIAEITKIQSEKTYARTRIIWLSNPRKGKPLRSYSFGVKAIEELFGKAEDIARLDIVVSCASEEVPIDVINKVPKDVVTPYTSTLLSNLVLFAWSRKRDQIVFDREAVEALLKYSTQDGKKYSSSIPLVEAANQRIKLAKLAISFAVLTFSEHEGTIVVKKDHADAAHKFLEEAYAKPSLDYEGYSRKEIMGYVDITEEDIAYLNNFTLQHPDIIEAIMSQDEVTVRGLAETLGIDMYESKAYLAQLSTHKLLRRTILGFEKTPAFIKTVKEIDNGK